MNVDEPITIEDYNPTWPALFEEERARILMAVGELVVAVEHFGSTAVPGMAGKPIVDLLVGVADFRTAPLLVRPLEALGYENFGEIFIAGRLYLRKRGPPHFNVAVTAYEGEFWRTQLLVRDYLRANPAEAVAYSASKRAAQASGALLFSTYSQAKAPFLSQLIERARAWQRTSA